MNISVDVRGVEAVQRRLKMIGEELRDKVVTASLNKVVTKAQAEINRQIRAEYFVKADEVRNAMVVHKANRNTLKASIDIFGSKSRRGRSANMIHFLAALQGAGVAVKTRGAVGVKKSDLKEIGRQLGFKVKRGAGMKKIPGAFLGNKGRTVFIREGKDRLPIKPLQVIGFSQMFSSKKISKSVMDKVDRDLVQEIERAIKMVLAK
jgi:hypothetical protein